MKRRLNMAAGLIHQPKLVLMDEPTAGVDPQSRNHIFEMIEKLRDEGMSMPVEVSGSCSPPVIQSNTNRLFH
jgi:ABC-type multidrug transport system ATPase subunit